MAHSDKSALIAAYSGPLVAIGNSFVIGFAVRAQFLGPWNVSQLGSWHWSSCHGEEGLKRVVRKTLTIHESAGGVLSNSQAGRTFCICALF